MKAQEYFRIYAWSDCPFCIKAKNLLTEKGYQFEYVILDNSKYLLDFYKTIYNHTTVPIIVYNKGGLMSEQVIGGYDDLAKCFRGGAFKPPREDD